MKNIANFQLNHLWNRHYLLLLLLGPAFWLGYSLSMGINPNLGGGRLSWQFIMLVFAYPVLEEVVFRGLLLETVARYLPQHWGILSLANLLTSALFALAHLVYHSLGWSLLVFFPSLVFGYSKERYRGLPAPIILHCWYNFGFVWLFY